MLIVYFLTTVLESDLDGLDLKVLNFLKLDLKNLHSLYDGRI
jgi:hypothetical protein